MRTSRETIAGIRAAGGTSARPTDIWFEILENDPRYHKLTLHEDETVSLSPSVLCYPGSCGVAEGYHGWLERGVWRQA